MKILVVGRGGREHSVIMQLEKSEWVKEIYAAPGNGGIENHANCVAIDEMDIDGLVAFAEENKIDLTIVGSENKLNAGIANAIQDIGLKIITQTNESVIFEGS